MSHTITTIYTIIFVIIYLIFNLQKLKDWKIWKTFIIDTIFILMICAFFLVPLLEHKVLGDYVIFDENGMGISGAYVTSTVQNIKAWFIPQKDSGDIYFFFGLPTIVFLLLGIFIVKKIKEKDKVTYISFFMMAIISLWLCTKFFPWIIMPNILAVVQFAWRLNGFFVFFASFLAGYNIWILIDNYAKTKVKKDIFTVVSILFIFICASLWQVIYYEKIEEQKSYTSHYEEVFRKREKIGVYELNREYLPCKALEKAPIIQIRENKTYILSGEANIISEQKVALTDNIRLEKVKSGTKLELPYIYYLGYKCTIAYDKNEINIPLKESENGFLQLELDKDYDNIDIQISYEGTTLEKASYIISLIGIILFISYLIHFPKERKRKYAKKSMDKK